MTTELKTYKKLYKKVEFTLRAIKEDGKTYICKNDVFKFLGLERYPYPQNVTNFYKEISKDAKKDSDISFGDKSYKYSFVKKKDLIVFLSKVAKEDKTDVGSSAKILLEELSQ